ncbi:MAG: cytochrome C, partial [Deltaproteobacteria bacterium]|nr:cytochrome C [Deltaproteobacteria bacterium]
MTGGWNEWVKANYPTEPKPVTSAKNCVLCHTAMTPGVVSDWKLSKHSQKGVDCAVCHGDKHFSPETVALAEVPTPERCAYCHGPQVKQFEGGKHAKAWASLKAMPTFHMQPMAMMDGMKGCGGCHKIGIKTKDEIKELRTRGGQFGVASCDSCHTRHVFSKKEAQQPQACRTCHMGIDHPQWEMYSSSKHGVRYLLKQSGVLPENAAAPTCQSCHMSGGNHGVRTAWGFVAVRLPMPQDPKWAADRTTIIKGLGALDPSGKPTARLGVLKDLDVFRTTQEDWQK